MSRITAAKKSVIFLLAVLLVMLAISFLPLGNGSNRSGNEKSALLLQQMAAVDNLPPAVDAKIDPAVKEQVKAALYDAAAATSAGERKAKEKVSLVIEAKGDVSGKVKDAKGVVTKKAQSVGRETEFLAVDVGADKVAGLAGDSGVVKVYPKVTYYPVLDESVPLINADSFWSSGFRGGGIKVAVLDTGIDKNHPMLQGKVAAERDFSNSGNVNDNFGHGTHVAGIIAGTTANGGMYSGVAPDAQLLNAKVIGDNGLGDNVNIIAGIGWAVDNGARVISMSLGASSSLDASVDSAIKDAVVRGVIVVVASGNCGSGCPSASCGSFRGVTSPGSSPNAISVGAVDKSKSVACFSGGGSIAGVGIKPDFVAPGVGIKSSVAGGSYRAMDGTSMATPHVSGAVALLLSRNPGLNQSDIERILEKTSLDLGDIGKDTSYGFGMIDMAKALVYREGLEFKTELGKQVISGSSENIRVTVYDDVQVNSVKAIVTKPDGAKSAEVTFAGVGNNVYSYDYAGTDLMGNYVVDISVNYGGSSGGSNIGSGASGDMPSVTATATAYFKVTSLTGDFGNVEETNISQQQWLSKNLTGNITFANIAATVLNFSSLLQLLDNGTLVQEIRLPAATLAAGSKVAVAVNNAFEAGPGNYMLRILTDYGAGSLVNETNVSLVDDVAPQVLNVNYNSELANDNPLVFVATLAERSGISNITLVVQGKKPPCPGICTLAYSPPFPVIVNYTSRILFSSGKEKQVVVTAFDTFSDKYNYTALLNVCDEPGNCAVSGALPFNMKTSTECLGGMDPALTVIDEENDSVMGSCNALCSGKKLLVAKTYEQASAFEEAAADNGGVCLSMLNRSSSGTPPGSYLKKFDAVVWTTGTDLANIDASDAAALVDYYSNRGKLVVEGSDVAFRHGSDDFIHTVLHSELKTDLGFTVTSVDNMSSLSINVTRPHPVVAGLGSSVFFNATIDQFPDSVQPYNGGVELAAWSGLDAKGSAVVAYESKDGTKKSLLLPFSIEALNTTAAKTSATNVLGWLLAGNSADIEPVAISHGVLVDGEAASIGIDVSATGSQWAPAKPSIAVFVDDEAVSQGEVDMPSAGSYSYNFTAALKAGQHVLKAVANAGFSAIESNYVNNVKEYNVTVYPKAADLLLTGFSYSYNNTLGAIVALVNVSNFGGSAASSALKAYLDGKETASANIELSAGETGQAVLELPSQEGVFQFKAVVDPDNSVAEYNESNNELQQAIYLCSREKVLVVDDNDAALFSTSNPSSSGDFLDVLRRNSYCVEKWDEAQQGVPGIGELNSFKVVVWSAGNYFNGTISNDDAIALGNYTGGLLLEGSDVGLDLANDPLFERLTGVVFSSDMLLNESQPESLALKNHSITANISAVNISKEKSPYPDSVEAVSGDVVAEWQNGEAAITARSISSGRKAAYYAFSLDGITDAAAAEKLVLNTVQWLLERVNSPPGITSLTADGMPYDVSALPIELTMNEGETGNFSLIAFDLDNDPLAYTWLLNGAVVSTTQNLSFSPRYNENGTYNLTAIVTDGQAEARAEIFLTVLDTMECDPGRQAKLCQLQLGVCAGSSETCNATGEWQGCTPAVYSAYSSKYEVSEASCDGLDNDCDGEIDEGRVCNAAPKLQAVGNRAVQENETLAFTVAAGDADGDVLVYNATRLPEGASFDNTTAAFAWAPNFDQAGVYTVEFNVSDGLAFDYEMASITVTNVNRPPVIQALLVDPPGLDMSEGESRTFTVLAIDEDGNDLIISWKLDGKVVASQPAYTYSPIYNDSGQHTLEVTVTDGQLSTSGVVALTVDDTLTSDVRCSKLLNVTRDAFGSRCGSPSYSAAADINGDGVINIMDLTAVGLKFSDNSWCGEMLVSAAKPCS